MTNTSIMSCIVDNNLSSNEYLRSLLEFQWTLGPIQDIFHNVEEHWDLPHCVSARFINNDRTLVPTPNGPLVLNLTWFGHWFNSQFVH